MMTSVLDSVLELVDIYANEYAYRHEASTIEELGVQSDIARNNLISFLKPILKEESGTADTKNNQTNILYLGILKPSQKDLDKAEKGGYVVVTLIPEVFVNYLDFWLSAILEVSRSSWLYVVAVPVSDYNQKTVTDKAARLTNDYDNGNVKWTCPAGISSSVILD